MSVCYLDNANGFPGEVEAGVEQEGEDEGESSVPAERRHKRAALRAEGPETRDQRPPPLNHSRTFKFSLSRGGDRTPLTVCSFNQDEAHIISETDATHSRWYSEMFG